MDILKKEKLLALILSSDDILYEKMIKNMGIGIMNPLYIEINENQDRNVEYDKILIFLRKYMDYYAKNNNISTEEIKLEFINYGKTELVYVLTDKNNKKVTLLVKQPIVKFRDVYQEMQYLLKLKEKDKNVVAPIDYFSSDEQELYVTPYINQARCVASYGTWGMYVPEPFYRFESFTEKQESVVNACMISKLVSLYDFENQEGISNCKLGGGDFMLEKGWEQESPTIENTLNKLYFIAARKKVKCSFNEYLEIIKEEFLQVTIDENKYNPIINIRGRVPMKEADIEAGINLGKSLINNENEHNSVKILKI